MASRKRAREEAQVQGGNRDGSARSRCELCGVGRGDCSIQLLIDNILLISVEGWTQVGQASTTLC